MKFSLLFFLLFCTQLYAAEKPILFNGLGEDIQDSFTGDALPYHLGAIALTPAFVYSNVDASIQSHFEDHPNDRFTTFGSVAGNFGPLMVGLPIFLQGKMSKNNETVGASFAIAHSTIIALTYISTLKFLTGRSHAENSSEDSAEKQSREFRFGFSRNGIVDGWPSGHVGMTTTLLSTLAHYYPEKVWLKYFGISFVSYMFYTVISHNEGQYHWFSDGVAGAMMGYAIGSEVGDNFRERYRGATKTTTSKRSQFLPLVGRGQAGIIYLSVF
jgi:hypothetical protein